MIFENDVISTIGRTIFMTLDPFRGVFGSQYLALPFGYHPADNRAAVHVNNCVGVGHNASPRSFELGYVPRPYLIRSGGNQTRRGMRGMALLKPTIACKVLTPQ